MFAFGAIASVCVFAMAVQASSRAVTIAVLSVLVLTVALQLWTRQVNLRLVRRAEWLLARAANVPTFRNSMRRFKGELTRARRYQRPLTVACVSPQNLDQTSQPGMLAETGSFIQYPLLGCMLQNSVRESDAVAFDATTCDYIILFAEADKQQASRCLARVHNIVSNNTDTRIRAGLATFPADGYTLEDLVRVARTECRTQNALTPAAGSGPMLASAA